MTTKKLATVRLTRHLAASPERVFDAFLDPSKMAVWMKGPAIKDEVVKCEIDARIGGKFLYVVRRDGANIEHSGTYRALERPKHLVYTFVVSGFELEEPSVITVDLVPSSGGTELTLTHTGILADYAKQTEAGWGKIVEALDRAA